MSKITLSEGAAPATPNTGEVVLYAKTDGYLYAKDDAGNEWAVSNAVLGTPLSGTLTNCTGLPQAGTVGLTTEDSPQFAGVNVGHATDTTLTRASAGKVAVEGATLAFAGANSDITSLTALTSVPLDLNLPLINGYIEWSISGNALTAAVKTMAGADPSATTPVFATFRDPTLTTATYYPRSITAALSVTASSGSTLGTVSAQASRIRAVLMDNAGTVVIGLYNSWQNSPKKLLGLNESLVYSSTAEGGAGAADSAHVIYTASAQTSKAIRQVSYVDSTQTTAGTWAQALTNKVQITGTTPPTGAVLQYIPTTDGTLTTGTTTTPSDNTIPQNTEGVAVTTLDTAITPMSASNILEVDVFIGTTSNSAAGLYTLALFQDATAGALAAASVQPGAGQQAQMSIPAFPLVANTTSATTFKSRVGGSAAGTQSINGDAGAQLYGGVSWSCCIVKEIMV